MKDQKTNRQSNAKNQVSIPAARKIVNTNKAPKLSSTPQGTVVRHKEMFLDPVSNNTFQHFQKPMNPALATSFPWLSKIAGAYETYRFRKLKFSYVPQCSTTSSGSFGMYFDYDPTDGFTTSMKQFTNMY